jgi:hypothetical protein
LCSNVSNLDHLLQDLLNGGSQVLHEMEAVSDLNCIGCAVPGTFSERARTIACDDLHTRMGFEPASEGRGTRITKQLDWPSCAEINQDGFEIQPPAIGPFVHTEKLGRHSFRQSGAAD